jgi:hypothetical protein
MGDCRRALLGSILHVANHSKCVDCLSPVIRPQITIENDVYALCEELAASEDCSVEQYIAAMVTEHARANNAFSPKRHYKREAVGDRRASTAAKHRGPAGDISSPD